ncbi:hypothetical protein BJ165DRAFT_927530 [Panaeolus papilionaceus]|nr:hypothetical protein BJ165DRAFT_927530 [Panaeolus papilionaceus]
MVAEVIKYKILNTAWVRPFYLSKLCSAWNPLNILNSHHVQPFYSRPSCHSVKIIGMEVLLAHLPNGAYPGSDGYDASVYGPETRLSFVKRLEDWASEPQTKDTRTIIWLHGQGGTGKTRLAKALVKKHGPGSNSNLVAASFFFNRKSIDSTDEMYLVPTLAYQLASSIPLLRPCIEAQVLQDSNIFTKPPRQQKTNTADYN